MNDFFEYTFHWDDAPLDISGLFAEEIPAGKFGFLQKEGDGFVFENGRKARFWGVLINSAACFPEHAVADKVARRLAKFGVNMVRLHQFDAQWATPNIFQFTKGTLLDSTRKLDEKSLDRLDYLIYALKREGIYVSLDLLVYRTFKEKDGLPNVGDLSQNGAKPYSCFYPQLIELQKEYAQQLLCHVNPYTGRSLAEDPVLALINYNNENDLFNPLAPVVLEPYRSYLLERFRAWAEAHRPEVTIPDDYAFDFQGRVPDELILHFYHDMMKEYYDDMDSFLRSIGVKIPLCGNSWTKGLTLVSAMQNMDYTSANVYWDLWSDRGSNKDITKERMHTFGMIPSKVRIKGKPLYITEYDMVWPNEWRAVSPLMVASLGAFQSWSGMNLHTYSYHSYPVDCMGGTILGGIHYRRNFETFMDPAKFGLFYACSLLFRRGDVSPASQTQSVALREEDIYNPVHGMSHHNLPNVVSMANCEKHRVEIELPHQGYSPGAIGPDDMGEAALDEKDVLSDTGELYRSWDKGYGWIDTARTKSIYGEFSPGMEIELENVKFTLKGGFGTLTLTSLTGEDLEHARLILLTAVGRADNSGALYNQTHTERISIGHGPVLCEKIHAKIEMKSTVPHMDVWSIDPDGAYTGVVDYFYKDGVREIHIGDKYPSIYYLISI